MGMYGIELELDCKDPSLTKQSFAKECDIDTMVKSYGRTGDASIFAPTRQALEGDFTQAQDFTEAMNLVTDVNRQFAGLSSQLRDKFENNPVKYLEFMNNDSNLVEAVKLGLIAGEVKELNDSVTPPVTESKTAQEAVSTPSV